MDGTPGFAANRPGWYKPIKDLLEENRVTIFFHGHDHFFGKQVKNCMVYQETPQPSHPNFSSTTYATSYGYVQGQILPNSGHIRVTVDSNGAQVQYVRVYKPADESATRHNKDISATYYIGAVNCYDTLSTGVPVLWNSNYADELVYPNPFSSETKIEFSIPAPERVDLTIYNEKGELVRKLINGSVVQTGKYEVIWDAKNFADVSMPNGVYFYSLKAESTGTKSGKLILIK